MTDDKALLTAKVKDKAAALGFDDCGITPVTFLENNKRQLEEFLFKGWHGNMAFLTKNTDKRLDPGLLVEEAKSVVVVILNYFPSQEQNPGAHYKVARYAYGRDYHKVLKKKLKELQVYINTLAGEAVSRCFVDSAPVMESTWAQKAGLGQCGKNTLLIHPRLGSWFVIGEIITAHTFSYDTEIDFEPCGRCSACQIACPTDALLASRPYQLDASQCLSYQTIENKDKSEFSTKNKDRIFGCDICQEVCPHNRVAIATKEKDFSIKPFIANASDEDWENLTQQEFEEYFTGSPIKRAGYSGLQANIRKVKGNRS